MINLGTITTEGFSLSEDLVAISKLCFGGRNFEHALKHGARHSLFVVTLGWFVDNVRKNDIYADLARQVGLMHEDIHIMLVRDGTEFGT
ncbi:hypothetical protein L6164_015787 [Bauhinia variegata]|uniref:Uncharacterized protein n=1 Tax=Bauhinia variegata TaxID=167791 RepID=A0ACB9NNG1_BAUVA|nr:hypothetical protein L6164_015787 [Bauhinia variegata]